MWRRRSKRVTLVSAEGAEASLRGAALGKVRVKARVIARARARAKEGFQVNLKMGRKKASANSN